MAETSAPTTTTLSGVVRRHTLDRGDRMTIARRDGAVRPVLWVTLYAAVALQLMFVHYFLVQYTSWDRTILEEHAGVMGGKYFAPMQYRVLTYWLAEAVSRLGLSLITSYHIQYLVLVFATLVAFHVYLREWCAVERALLGCVVLALILAYADLWYVHRHTDVMNLFLLTVGMLAIKRDQPAYLIPVIAAGALNRESIVVLPLVQLIVGSDRSPAKRLLWFAATTATAILGFVILWRSFGPRPTLYSVLQLHSNLRSIKTYILPPLLFHVFWLLPWPRWQRQPAFLRRSALLLVPGFLAVNMLIAVIAEVRVLLPLSLVLIPMGLLTLFDAEPSMEVSGR